MSDYRKEYEFWLENDYFDEETKNELRSISNDEKEIEERFYRDLEFGTGDPESTGKALGVLGILYAAYGKGITVIPDFYEKRLVAELAFKGRIRLGTLLLKGVRLIRDKQVKRFIKNFKRLLKVLKQKAE